MQGSYQFSLAIASGLEGMRYASYATDNGIFSMRLTKDFSKNSMIISTTLRSVDYQPAKVSVLIPFAQYLLLPNNA